MADPISNKGGARSPGLNLLSCNELLNLQTTAGSLEPAFGKNVPGPSYRMAGTNVWRSWDNEKINLCFRRWDKFLDWLAAIQSIADGEDNTLDEFALPWKKKLQTLARNLHADLDAYIQPQQNVFWWRLLPLMMLLLSIWKGVLFWALGEPV